MHDTIQALGWGLLHSVWQLAVLAALYAGVCALLPPRAARLRYTIGVAALALVCALPASVVWRQTTAVPAPRAASAAEETAAATAAHREPEAAGVGESSPLPIREDTGLTSSWRRRLETLLPGLVLAWFAGVALFTLRLAFAMRGVGRLRRSARPAPPEIAATLRGLAARLDIGRHIAIGTSPSIDVPMAFGILRPMVLVPVSLLTALPLAQLEVLLLHELAHLRRRDYLVNLLQCVAETLFFFHPAVWWLSARVRAEREHCCDDLVVETTRDRTTYARALARLEAVRGKRPFTATAALGVRGSGLAGRIRRLLENEATRARHRTAAAALLLAVLMVVGGFALGQRTPEPGARQQGREASQELDLAPHESQVLFELLKYDAPPGAAELLGIDWLSAGPGLGPASRSAERVSVDVGRVRDPSDLGWRLGAAKRRGLIGRRTRHVRVVTLLGEEAVIVEGDQLRGVPLDTLRMRMLPQRAGERISLHLGVETQSERNAAGGERRAEFDLSLRDGDTLLIVIGTGAERPDAPNERLLFLTIRQPPAPEPPAGVPR